VLLVDEEGQLGRFEALLRAFIREGNGDKSYFNRIGASWDHKDGEGRNIELDTIPLDGRITLRKNKERLDDIRDSNAETRQRNEQGQER